MTTADTALPDIDLAPAAGRVAVIPDVPETQTSFGLALPENAQSWPQTGVVAAVGPNRNWNTGTVYDPTVQVGDRVVFDRNGGTEIERDGQKILLMPYRDLLAVVAP